MKKIIVATLLLLNFYAPAQKLARKGTLGVGLYTNIPDSIRAALNYESGAIIHRVFPNTTAHQAGVLPNDIITQVNGLKINSGAELVNFAKTLRSGNPIKIELIRNRETLTFNSNVVPKPYEQSAVADIEYGEFKYKSGLVRTIYKSPKGKTPKAFIYFLQGLPCYSLDNLQPLDKTKQALDKLVELGYAVYLMEKGDMGDNENCPPCATMGFHEELAMYDAGYQHFKKLPKVDSSNIFLFGHSMGGTTAPLLAGKYQPKGIIVYGTGFKPWSEYLMDTYLVQLSLRGKDLGDLRDHVESFKPYIHQYFYTDTPIEEIAKDAKGLITLNQLLGYNPTNQTGHSGRHVSTFKELNQVNVAKGLSRFNNYTLAIYGECDLNANNALDHQALINHVNTLRPGHGTFWMAPKSSHSFEEIGTMKEFLELWDNPTAYHPYAAQRFNGKIFEYVDKWMDSVQSKKITPQEPQYFSDASHLLPEPGAKKASMDCKAADIDSDGDLDIILANEFQPNSILLNNGKGLFSDAPTRLPQVIHDSEDVITLDADGDKDLDLIFCSEDDKIHEFYLNDGKGQFSTAPFKFEPSEANAVISGDINKDGKPDVIFGNNGQNVIYINQGNGNFKAEPARLPALSRVTQDLALLDLDNDGDLDLVEANEDGNVLYQNTGKGYFKNITKTHFAFAEDMETRKIAFADVDNDGDLDLFFANVNFKGTKNAQNRLYINNGKGKFTDETFNRLPVDTDHTIDAIFEDIDNDKDPDLVVANVFGGKVKVYLNDQKGRFSIGSDKLLGGKLTLDALGVISADLNGDGKRDLYICDRYQPQFDRKDALLIRE